MRPERLIPRGIARYDVLASTNEKAKEILERGTEEGAVILAARQASGRGRYGRAWASPPGGLYLSIVLKPRGKNIWLLSLLSGLPVVRMLRSLGIDASLKWPNDVLVGDLKVGGILCEGVYRHDVFWAIVGIGINVAVDLERLPPDVQSIATSVNRAKGSDIEPDFILGELLREYDDFYAAFRMREIGRLLEEYRGLCSTLKKSITIKTAMGIMKGQAIEVSPKGALVLDANGKKIEIFEGTIVKAE